jgi:hypothetical protein
MCSFIELGCIDDAPEFVSFRLFCARIHRDLVGGRDSLELFTRLRWRVRSSFRNARRLAMALEGEAASWRVTLSRESGEQATGLLSLFVYETNEHTYGAM